MMKMNALSGFNAIAGASWTGLRAWMPGAIAAARNTILVVNFWRLGRNGAKKPANLPLITSLASLITSLSSANPPITETLNTASKYNEHFCNSSYCLGLCGRGCR